MPTRVRSHAKINLGLAIGAPRRDGFHALTTVYQTLELHDVVTVTVRPAKTTAIRLMSNDARVPLDKRNTAYKMVELALEALGIAADVVVDIDKRLPIQGGMGAGSANAVAALVGLEVELAALSSTGNQGTRDQGNETGTRKAGDEGTREQGTEAGTQGLGTRHWRGRRLEVAAQVGSDVPLFLIGGTVLGVDRGQEVYPLPDLEATWCVVALPEVGVSTPQAFRDWDALCASDGLTEEGSAGKLNELSRAYVNAFAEAIPGGGMGAGSSGVLSAGRDLAGPQESALVRTGISSWIQNDFERVVFDQHPSLREIKRLLAASGSPEAALCAMLSGSGSALFGLYRTKSDAEAAQARLQSASVASALTKTLPRREYWGQMLL